MARALRDEFAQRCGGAAPALVASTLHRRKVDLNRAHELAFERGGGGSAPWGCYHAALAAALEEAVGRAGFALLLDVCLTGLVSPPTTCSRARVRARIGFRYNSAAARQVHGQDHRAATELGYNLSAVDLLRPD